MLVCWAFFNDFANGQKVLGEGLSHVGKLISLKFVQGWNDAVDKHFRIKDQTEVGKPSYSCGSHLWLNIF